MEKILPDPNRYNERIVALVQECNREILELAHEHGFRRIVFSEHPKVDTPHAIFEDVHGNYGREDIESVTVNEETGGLDILSVNFGAYTDMDYGDYFDVGESLPRIYAAIVQCIADGITEEER